MILQQLNGIEFRMKETYNFDFLNKYGKVFDDQDSGNICFGIENESGKIFVKYAGAPTVNYNGVREEAVNKLKDSVSKYKELEHPNLIRFICSESIAGDYLVVFKWAEGDCMGRMYPESHKSIMALPNEVKYSIFSSIIDFIEYANNRGYVAVDFYDGSIMYDVKSATTTICDIDYFEKNRLLIRLVGYQAVEDSCPQKNMFWVNISMKLPMSLR